MNVFSAQRWQVRARCKRYVWSSSIDRGVIELNVLYFIEPQRGRGGGVANVARNLPKALANKIGVTYFPAFTPRRSYAVRRLNVFRSLAMKNFDIVHFNVTPSWTYGSYVFFEFAKINGASTILNIHGIVQIEYNLYNLRTTWLSSARARASRTLRCCKIADKIVTYSEFMRTNIVTWYRVNRDKIAVIPNGVDVKKFSECDSELSLEGDPAILYLGGLGNFKSPDLLIHAIARLRSELPKIKLHLVGYGAGDEFAALEELAKKKEVEKHVVLHGYVVPEKTPQYYKAADICIFPSRRDSAGITLLEAMASGTPVIASNRGGTPEIISHGKDGILFEPEDADALPKAILALHQDSELRKTISYNALKTVAKYSWEEIAEKYIHLYRTLV